MRSFFGDCDKKGKSPHGKIVNTNPMWTKDKVIADMSDSIREIEQQEHDGLFVSAKARAKKRTRKTDLIAELKRIKESDPRGKVKGKDLDILKSSIDSFVEEIRNISPTHHDNDQAIKKGETNVNPTVQGFRSKRPCIKLKSEDEISVAKACNMRIDDNGMVSRDDLTRGTWLAQMILGIRPDHRQLRRSKQVGHIVKSNQVVVGTLPDDMQKSHESDKGQRKKMALSQ